MWILRKRRQHQQQWRRQQREDVSTRADHEPADQTQDWSKERIGFELILRKRISSPTIIIVLLLLLLLLFIPLSQTIDDHVTGLPISTMLLRNALPMRNGSHRSYYYYYYYYAASALRGSIVDKIILMLLSSHILSLPHKRGV